VNGRYRIAIRKKQYEHDVSHVLDRPSDGISITGVLRQSAGDPGDVLGLVCVSERPGSGYAFMIWPNEREFLESNLQIDKILRREREPQLLAQGQDDVVKPRGAANRVRVDCVGARGRTPARLTLYANGKLVAYARDPSGYGRFEGVGLRAWNNAGRATALFDEVVVRQLEPAD
jgi:hypothetical protein